MTARKGPSSSTTRATARYAPQRDPLLPEGVPTPDDLAGMEPKDRELYVFMATRCAEMGKPVPTLRDLSESKRRLALVGEGLLEDMAAKAGQS